MRRLFIAIFLLSALTGLRAADAEFIRVWPPVWRAAETLERIGEYFGGEEKHGKEIMLRSDAKERAGYYFLVRVKHAAPLDGAKFVVHVIRPDAPDVRDLEFPVAAAPAGESVFQLGLTGAGWNGGAKASPVAWKLDLVDHEGRVLATQKSFLWEKPAK
jgi:hypothetical protein